MCSPAGARPARPEQRRYNNPRICDGFIIIPSTQETDKPAPAGDVILRQPGLDDGAAMWRLVKETGVLDLNSAYAYLLVAEHFGPTSVVADIDGEIVGFVSAYCPPHKPETVFVWQVGVAEAGRGCGLATRMLFDVIERPACRERGVRYLDTTIGPSNEASMALFRGFARKLGVEVTETELFGREHFPDPEAHEPEILFRIGPFDLGVR